MTLLRLAVPTALLMALSMMGASAYAQPSGSNTAGALPPACIAAGAKTPEECKAFLHKTAPKGAAAVTHAARPAPAAAAAPPPPKPAVVIKPPLAAPALARPAAAAIKPAPVAPRAPKPALTKTEALKPTTSTVGRPATDCTAPGAAEQPACAALRHPHAAKPETATAPPPAPTQVAPAGKTSVALPTGPAASTNATVTPKALHPSVPAAAPTSHPSAASNNATLPGKPVVPAIAATPGGKAGTPVPAAAPIAAAVTPAPVAGTPSGQLSPDCLAVGISTAAQCDAFQARKKRQGASVAGQQPAAGKQPLEPVNKLPPGVTTGQVAPLLDSAKQRDIGGGKASPLSAVVAAAPQAPPPANDRAAQAAFRVKKAPPLPPPSATPTAGTPLTSRIQLPQNVTVVNQTVVNTTTVNNAIVNNTTTNNNTAIVETGRPNHPGHPGAVPPGEPVPLAGRPPNPIGLAIGAVLQIGNQLVVDSSGRDQYRISGGDRDRTDYSQLAGDRYMETIYRPEGVRVVTIYDHDGDILRRSRFGSDGHETVLAYFDYRDDHQLGQWRDPGADLPPLQLNVDVNNYVLDGAQADEGQLSHFLEQPPVEPVPRLYSIDEVERSARLRDIMPRVELDDLTFDTGSASLPPTEVQALSRVANAMLSLLQANPAETFLIEGHTDAVGSPASNLVLSDARAASVAQALTDTYHVPPENLATQGYGSEFLRIQTADAERLNRRVVIRRITPLVTIAQPGD
jgi:outer membrane protein OmpA-like peptidoglycan-associated protein